MMRSILPAVTRNGLRLSLLALLAAAYFNFIWSGSSAAGTTLCDEGAGAVLFPRTANFAKHASATADNASATEAIIQYKGIVILGASLDKFGLVASLGSSALFDLHGWLPVVLVNKKSYSSAMKKIDGLLEWITNHNLCVVPVQYPDKVPEEDHPTDPNRQTFVRYNRLLVTPYLPTILERECGIKGVNNDTFVVLGDGDLWPVHDEQLLMMKNALEYSQADPKPGIVMQGGVVKDFPWKRRALCYTGGFIWGWKKYMNATGDMLTDWENHLVLGRQLRGKLRETWNWTGPLSHMDEFIFGWNLLENKVDPVVELASFPRRIGKNYNASWILKEHEVALHLFEHDDVHLGHNLKPKTLMNVMLRMALSEKDIAQYWSIYQKSPRFENIF